MVAGDCGYDVFSRLNGAAGWGRMLCFSYRNPNLELRHFSSSIRNASSLCLKDNKNQQGIFYPGGVRFFVFLQWIQYVNELKSLREEPRQNSRMFFKSAKLILILQTQAKDFWEKKGASKRKLFRVRLGQIRLGLVTFRLG